MPTIGEPFSPRGVFSSVWIPPAIFHNPNLSPSTKLCYGRMAYHCGSKDHCWPSQESLASDLGVSTRTIRECLAQLEDEGYIKTQRVGLNRTNIYYLLWFQGLEDCIRILDRKKTSDQEGIKSVDMQETSALERKKTSGPIRSKSIELIQPTITPVVPSSRENLSNADQSLDLEDDVIAFVQNAYRRENRRAKLDNLRAKSNEHLCELIRESEQDDGPEAWRSALLAYLADTSDWLVEQKWPIRVFLKRPSEYVYAQPASVPRRAPSEPVPVSQHPPIQPAACNARETANEFAEKWNRLVPSAPVELPLHYTAAARLDALLAVPEFASNFQSMAEKIEKIRQERGDDVDWLVFHWLIQKPKNGDVENWQKVIAGRFNYMANKRKPKGRDSPGDVISRMREKLKLEIQEEQRGTE